MYLGSGSKCSGWQGKQLLYLCIELRGRGKQAIVAGARLGGDAVGNFALHHDHNSAEIAAVFEKAEKDVGGDVVREIADDIDGLGSVLQAGPLQPGLGTEDDVEVDSQNVAFDDFGIGHECKPHTKLSGEDFIKFDRNQAASSADQHRGQNAGARTDFQDGTAGRVAQSFDDTQGGALVVEEMLAEFWF